jgi:glycyl-tRNA synthetase beta chain
MARLLVELRTEEIPANALPAARDQLEAGFVSGLEAAGYEDAEVAVCSTARRLAVMVDHLAERQPDRSELVTGPPTSVAYGKDGTPTKAAEGFARKVGLAVDDLDVVSTTKGEYVAATVRTAGRPTAEIVAELIPSVVASLRFPKTMRWGLGHEQFVRPVHGVLAALDGQPVAVQLFGLEAGCGTIGHPRLATEGWQMTATDPDYVAALAERGVLVDPAERRRRLETTAARLAAEVGCAVHPDPELVAEHVELVEHPGLLRGTIAERFLELPREVVITTLRHHQKCLILERDGALAPYFLAVIDRPDDPEGLIQQGNEWVIGARLADAEFFFAEDRKRTMAERASGLDRLELHATLGSMGAKATRVAALAEVCATAGALELGGVDLAETAALVKADLMSQMVGEFPELQGIMGGHYLRLEGASEAVWTAARDHYRPLGFEGDTPVSELGRVLGLADRIDTVAGLFAVGELPTGSRDPFGLRRAAQGAVRIAAESGWDLHLGMVIDRAVGAFEPLGLANLHDAARGVHEFVAERVRRYLIERIGVAYDTADAVMAAGWERLPETVARARALQQVRTQPEFRVLATAFKRVRNILADQEPGQLDPELAEHAEERELVAAVDQLEERLAGLVGEGRFVDAFEAAAQVGPVLDRFFEAVLVMAPDPKLRDNRIAVLAAVSRNFTTLADLSRLQVEGSTTA